jgi:hypothetical protein
VFVSETDVKHSADDDDIKHWQLLIERASNIGIIEIIM